MSRHRSLDPKAKEYIVSQIREHGEVSTESVMELIRPHYQFDPLAAKEHLIRRTAHSVMRSIKDVDGTRTCFACKDNERNSLYVNIETSTDRKKLLEVEEQLKLKLSGLETSYQKTKTRRIEVDGQLTFFTAAETA